ncbi:MAG: YceI family protein [Desulfobacterales bacterium]|nr:MAG: YceI family protein [Desulfobacterales bacterium]
MRNRHPKIRIRIIWFAALLVSSLLILPQYARPSPESEQLIVFVQSEISAVDDRFQEFSLPKIRRLAESMDIGLHVVDARQGSPWEVAITPLVVYQNHRGRSVYQGRTTTTTRIRNFIRTSRYVPQGKELNRRENIPIWSEGRSRVWAPLKVAAVTGTPPQGYEHDIFVADALKNIVKGFKKFRLQEVAELGRADRGFYIDFNPWRSDDGTLFITVVVFSQFDCKKPVFTEKIVGPWQDYRKLFRQAAAAGEKAVIRIAADPNSGDSFDPVKNDVAHKNWNQIGFPLPAAPEVKTADVNVSAVVPQNWILAESAPYDPPMIQFRFPAPLDNYAGEVKSGRGEVLLPENLKVNGATGFIEIDTRTAITMGEPRLDEAIRGSMMLYSKKFPTARFTVEKISGDDRPVAYGRLSPAAVFGKFSLKGKTIPLTAVTEVEPVMGEDGKPLLLARGTFEIDLRTFDIEGADGPAPARHILHFDLNLIFREKQENRD